MDWGFTLSVVLVGMVVVFCVLVALVLMCYLMGKVFVMIGNRKNGTPNVKPEKTEKQPEKTIVTKAVATAPAPVVESGISDDVVAAISAAIACITGESGKLAIKSIKRVKGARPVWSTASIMENTRPF